MDNLIRPGGPFYIKVHEKTADVTQVIAQKMRNAGFHYYEQVLRAV